jgi:hypothetical protein
MAHEAAAELRRLHAENERLHQINQSHEMKLSVRGYETQIDDLRLAHAELHALSGELLEALKQAAEYLHDKSGCSWLRSDFQNGCRCSEDCSSIAVWKKARAAIAKAEGQA